MNNIKNGVKRYWEKYYSSTDIVGKSNYQASVGRTRGGEPISSKKWRLTLEHIVKACDISHSSRVLELCCGNGQVIGPISLICKEAYGVDYSIKLLNQLNSAFKNVNTQSADVLDVTYPTETFDVIIIYFSIQHFDEKETVSLVEKALGWLVPGGRLLIGDIPDSRKKWKYISKSDHRSDYISRTLNDSPMIGTWYDKEFFKALGDYFKGIIVNIKEQPVYQINHDYRFDTIITKDKA